MKFIVYLTNPKKPYMTMHRYGVLILKSNLYYVVIYYSEMESNTVIPNMYQYVRGSFKWLLVDIG